MNESPRHSDQLLAELRDRAAEFGFVLAGRCKHCMKPISDLRSLHEHAGPVCRERHGDGN